MNDELIIENAVITYANITSEGNVLLSEIGVEYAKNGCQGIPAICLYNGNREEKDGDFTGYFLNELLKTVGVKKFTDLVGKNVRIEHSWDRIEKIGNILENEWFNFTAKENKND